MQRAGRRKLDLSVQEEPDVVRQIDAIARTEGISRSAVIRKVIRLGLDRYTKRERIVNAVEEGAA